MIPGLSGIGDAIKELSPLAKWVGGALIVVVMVVTASARGFEKGRTYERSQWQAIALAQQALASRDTQAHTENTNRVLAEQSKRNVRVETKIVYLDREVERYVEQTEKPCVLPSDYVRRWDALSRMLNDELLPASPSDGTGESPAVPTGSAEDAAGLPAYRGTSDNGPSPAVVP